MPIIKPVSELRNYGTIMKEVKDGQVVFLTKNGEGAYAILSMNDYQRYEQTTQLLSLLDEGRQSEKKGLIPFDQIKGKYLRTKQ
jgi:prevent-host-death family protein